jgi:tRNA dimethylallyltransferase
VRGFDCPVVCGAGSVPHVVIAIFGPTGVGKTAVGTELAKRLTRRSEGPPVSGRAAGPVGRPARREKPTWPSDSPPEFAAKSAWQRIGRIISCDSMQVYEGFPVLTNQPEAARHAGLGEAPTVPHALVGCVDPTAEFSALDYAEWAKPLIDEDLSSMGCALLVGGTGLYMRAALAPLAAPTTDSKELRARLEARAASEGPGALHADLARLDPAAARAIDARNVRRLVRALEAVSVSGKAWSGRDDLWAPAYYHPTLMVGLAVQRAELYRRIDARAALIVDGGAVEEVRRFRQEHGRERTRPGAGGVCCAIGYPEICRYLDGQQSRDETLAQVAAATRRYARRQLTWLRKLGDAVIIDCHERSPGDLAEEILALTASGEHTKGPGLP